MTLQRLALIASLIASAITGCHDASPQSRARDPELAIAGEQTAPREPRHMRRLTNDELTPELQRRAERVLESHADAPTGTGVPFDLGGRRYVGRIEEHYHPPGGPMKPWGPHKGVSLFVVEPAVEPAGSP